MQFAIPQDPRRVLGAWVLATFMLNLVWEVAHLPLYTFPEGAGWSLIVYDVLHCTVGDVMIASCIFLLTCLVLRDMGWIRRRPWTGAALVAVLGVSYTAYSEWLNVYVRQSWAYSSMMPLVFGLGVSPLVQWLILPFGITQLSRRIVVQTSSCWYGRIRHD